MLHYHLKVEFLPDRKRLQGSNTITFKTLKAGNKMQIDLQPPLAITRIVHGGVRVLLESRLAPDQPHGGAAGQAVDIEIQAKEIIRMRNLLEEIIAHHTGQPVERVRKDSDRDFIMSADEAKEYGIIDEVISVRESAPIDAAATATA